ncbi:hypothetical protein PHSY_003953 [Pseudozyma hubeiensis SY62]|uniref:Translin n=1 Tax=Pseudozyma hubeiensis (strain SY62) TaxID=1305764 RepID=R9P4M8_PSEHS|nr:hypothetical protein PHSY_003953 [Pseudozyma hubeiensis SY62]GAC96373.1 hypothetical protein PHSY_003953 [Pseudozyma hubeiensis SY62]
MIISEFEPLFQQLETERLLSDTLREKSKDLDRLYRSLSAQLNSVHSASSPDQFAGIVARTLPLWTTVRSSIAELATLLPEDSFYRWCDDFSYPLKNLTSLIALIVLLGSGGLVTKAQVGKVMGLDRYEEGKIQLVTEDYLHGLINAINELPRLAVNSVTGGDFRTPVRLARFVKEVHGGFQLLNLKNDSLRKRFDSLKYDVKKIEEIVYDISLRGLVNGEDTGQDGLAFRWGDERQVELVQLLATDGQPST